jgi:hypothetical protein
MGAFREIQVAYAPRTAAATILQFVDVFFARPRGATIQPVNEISNIAEAMNDHSITSLTLPLGFERMTKP